jgi:hypothetical protein|tara:strand:- start:107 stop:376 length:270 start_codon:yes stop_codon:yes gene_type:complete
MKAIETQVGGDHYKLMKIQPLEFIMANNMSYCEANVVKYISRWRSKNGVEDLRKARHYIDLLIEEATEDALDVLQTQFTFEPIDKDGNQ